MYNCLKYQYLALTKNGKCYCDMNDENPMKLKFLPGDKVEDKFCDDPYGEGMGDKDYDSVYLNTAYKTRPTYKGTTYVGCFD